MHVEGTRGYDGTPLAFEYDQDRDVLTVEGREYSGQLFRAWSDHGMATGTLFELRRVNGAFNIRRIWEPEQKKVEG